MALEIIGYNATFNEFVKFAEAQHTAGKDKAVARFEKPDAGELGGFVRRIGGGSVVRDHAAPEERRLDFVPPSSLATSNTVVPLHNLQLQVESLPKNSYDIFKTHGASPFSIINANCQNRSPVLTHGQWPMAFRSAGVIVPSLTCLSR